MDFPASSWFDVSMLLKTMTMMFRGITTDRSLHANVCINYVTYMCRHIFAIQNTTYICVYIYVEQSCYMQHRYRYMIPLLVPFKESLTMAPSLALVPGGPCHPETAAAAAPRAPATGLPPCPCRGACGSGKNPYVYTRTSA